jgi:flagellar export protein FliJ
MRKFQFTLQPLLSHRQRLEQTAKDAFLNKQSEILEMEALILGIARFRNDLLHTPILTLSDHQALEGRLQRADDEERMHQTALGVLRDESERLRLAWIGARQELEAVLKLREKAHAEWLYEAEREEQNALDEWATQNGSQVRRSEDRRPA